MSETQNYTTKTTPSANNKSFRSAASPDSKHVIFQVTTKYSDKLLTISCCDILPPCINGVQLLWCFVILDEVHLFERSEIPQTVNQSTNESRFSSRRLPWSDLRIINGDRSVNIARCLQGFGHWDGRSHRKLIAISRGDIINQHFFLMPVSLSWPRDRITCVLLQKRAHFVI